MNLLVLSVCLVAVLAMEVGHSFGASEMRVKRQLTLGGDYFGKDNYKVNAGYKWPKWGVSGSFRHSPGSGNSYGIQLSWNFEKRLSDLERAIVEMQEREITIRPDADQDETKAGSHEEHDAGYNSEEGSTHAEATDEANSSAEKGARGESRVKRQISFGAYGRNDNFGTHLGGKISHQFGSNSYNGHIDYSKPGGTSYGVGIGHTFDNGRGKVSGQFGHNPMTGDSYGVGYGHTFDNGRGKVSGQIKHNPMTGNSYGINFTWRFGKRLSNLERAVMEMRRRYKR